jgi:putative tricarboxylic transport membrane protein
VTCGDGDTVRIVEELEDAGADAIELGIPFSDPIADGPVIQAAAQRALAKGTTTKHVFEIAKQVREKSAIPLIAFSYLNPIMRYGAERFAFGLPFLQDGIEFLLVMVGAYGVGEVLTRMSTGFASGGAETGGKARFATSFPRWGEMMKMKATFARGTIAGLLVGVVPGAGATVSSFIAYGIENQYGKSRHKLGEGAPEGIVAAKSAATASVGGAFVPLLAMGIPGSGATAIILAAFLLHGIQPGPQVFTKSPELINLIFAAVLMATIGKCILGYFAIRPLCKVLEAPEAIVSAFVVVFCFVGALAQRNSLPDLYVMSAFGLIGFLFERFKFPLAPLVLGTILGPIAEANFMTTMVSFDNDWTVFFTRPISAAILALAVLGLAWPVIKAAIAHFRKAPSSGQTQAP